MGIFWRGVSLTPRGWALLFLLWAALPLVAVLVSNTVAMAMSGFAYEMADILYHAENVADYSSNRLRGWPIALFRLMGFCLDVTTSKGANAVQYLSFVALFHNQVRRRLMQDREEGAR